MLRMIDVVLLRLFLLRLLVEAVGFVFDVGVGKHADFARVGYDLPCGGVADALSGQELLLCDGPGGRLDGEEGDRAVEESYELRVVVVDGGEA